jgi:hypothetical protein
MPRICTTLCEEVQNLMETESVARKVKEVEENDVCSGYTRVEYGVRSCRESFRET